MSQKTFESLVILLGCLFAVGFIYIIIPPLMESGDIIGAFAAGFVNPYASGYSLDTIICGLILIVWVLYEQRPKGWIAIPLCIVPGVAVGLAYYLIIRSKYAAENHWHQVG